MEILRMVLFLGIAVVSTWLFSLWVGWAASPATAGLPIPKEIYGLVTKIIDGDTLVVQTNTPERHQFKVRLAEIDTPEKRQPLGLEARDELSSLVLDKAVTVKVQATDRYGRVVGRVWVGSVDVCARLVTLGLAWVYPQYATDPKLSELEYLAKLGRSGVWNLPKEDQIPPWEFRKNRRVRHAL